MRFHVNQLLADNIVKSYFLQRKKKERKKERKITKMRMSSDANLLVANLNFGSRAGNIRNI